VIDRFALPLVARLLAPPARALAGRGVRADTVTLAGFAVGMTAPLMIWGGFAPAALAAIAANRIADGLDGMIARLHGPTDRGAFLDIALDFVFYAAVPLGFALADPAANALPAVVLIFAFVGTMSSFLAFSVVAGQRGMRAADYPTKGIYYLGGLTEGTETIAVFVAMCLWPAAFSWLAYGFAAACAITTVTRWHMGWTTFRAPTD
jgi:phosphatidylglycerophosphate synthase